jgi:N-acetylneuraminate synthase
MFQQVFVIAEAGVNHNGSLDLALELVDTAAASGADAVKFQTFKADRLVAVGAPKAEYAMRTTDAAESQLDMIRKLELDIKAHDRIVERCAARGIEFMSTPFDVESAALLADRYKVRRMKIPSGEITNPLLLLAAARSGRPIILSTGMSKLGEIEDALGVLAFGYLDGAAPGTKEFVAAFESPKGQTVLRDSVTLLHCTTEYPAPFEDVNLRAMDTLASAFGLAVGYSDHTPGITMPIAAAARGACVIEKHFTLDRSMPGPDHAASVEPDQLAALITGVREVEKALGAPGKLVTASEQKNRPISRKSLVAAHAIAAGTVLREDDIKVKRPGSGASPMGYWDYVGRPATRDYAADELLD